jgi:hypothetical protein
MQEMMRHYEKDIKPPQRLLRRQETGAPFIGELTYHRSPPGWHPPERLPERIHQGVDLGKQIRATRQLKPL